MLKFSGRVATAQQIWGIRMQSQTWGKLRPHPIYNVEASKYQELVVLKVPLELFGRVEGAGSNKEDRVKARAPCPTPLPQSHCCPQPSVCLQRVKQCLWAGGQQPLWGVATLPKMQMKLPWTGLSVLLAHKSLEANPLLCWLEFEKLFLAEFDQLNTKAIKILTWGELQPAFPGPLLACGKLLCELENDISSG